MIELKVLELAESRIEALIENEKDQLISVGRQQVVNIVARLPISIVQGTTTPQTVVASTTAPTFVDLSEFKGPVRDQGNEGNTVGFAVAAAMEGLWTRKTGEKIILSPRYLYNSAKAAQNWKGDTGAFIKDAIQVASTKGAVLESVWQYKPGEFDSEPPVSLDNSEHYRAKVVREIKTLAEIKIALQSGLPVVGGITMFQSSIIKDTNGVIPDPGANDSIMGGHAICVVGYDDARKLLKFKNSWGISWGEAGYGYISYSYVEKNLSDAWVLEL